MKWKTMFITIVVNIFLMLLASIMLEYSDLTERYVSIEDTIQEALDLAIQASVHSEEFFTAEYQGKLMSYAASGGYGSSDNITTEATTLVWLENEQEFAQVNTYLMAKFYENASRLPSSAGDVMTLNSYGTSHAFGQSGYIFEWLYGGAGSGYLSGGLAYANKNSARIAEYTAEGGRVQDALRQRANSNFKAFYNSVGSQQQTVGYLKARQTDSSYKLELTQYSVLDNMGLSWMSGLTRSSSNKTSDNLCSSLHIGKARNSSLNTYYFLTPASLGVTYIPTEVLKPVFIANLDTISRLNKLGAANMASGADAADILQSASYCLQTSVFDYNTSTDRYENPDAGIHDIQYNDDGTETILYHKYHAMSSYSQDIVTDGLVEFDLSTAQVKVDYVYVDFTGGGIDEATVISKLNGTLAEPVGVATTEEAMRLATLQSFLTQDSGQNVSSLASGGDFGSGYSSVRNGRIIARVSAKIKVHVPYKSSILQWACYMFTGTRHFDIKMYDPAANRADLDSDGLWYQYTTYFCTSRS